MTGEAARVDLSIIVPGWNTRELVLTCLEAAAEAARGVELEGRSVELLYVDNGSEDGSAEAVRRALPEVERVALPHNLGFAGGCNRGIERARGRILLLLNSDALLNRKALQIGLAAFDAHPDVGAAGVQLLHADGRLQNSIHAFPSLVTELVPLALLESLLPGRFPSKRHRPKAPVEIDAPLGAVLFVRRDAVAAVGPLSTDYFFYLEETEWCWRMREAGWRVLHLPDAEVVHHSGAGSKALHPAASRIEFHRSLYRFLEDHRGPATRALSMGLRVLRNTVSLLTSALLSPLSPRHGERVQARFAVLRWHLRGCPPGEGLAAETGWTAKTERSAER